MVVWRCRGWAAVLSQCNATLTVVLYLMVYLSDCLDNHSLQQPGRNTLHKQVLSCGPSHPSWSMSAAARLPAASRCLSSHRLIREHRGHAHYKPLKRHEEPLPWKSVIPCKYVEGTAWIYTARKYISIWLGTVFIFAGVALDLISVTLQIQEQIRVRTSCRYTMVQYDRYLTNGPALCV